MDGIAGVERVGAGDLASVPLFEGLSDEERQDVAEHMRRLRAPVGTVLAEHGGLSSKAFLVLEGSLTIHREGRHVADLGVGDIVGETGTLALVPRNATVIATTPSVIAELMGWDLRELADRFPAVRARLEALVAARTGTT